MSEEHAPTAVLCPHAGCQGILRLQPTLPAGTYPCLCHGCQVQLTWSTRQPTFTRTPRATCACAPAAGKEEG
jgi:hypothetical protein